MSKPAGDFDAWLAQMRRVLRGEAEADVPCDGCVGCCVSSYPIPLRPTDTVALERVPDRHLEWPSAGGMARMGFRDDGSCPMLVAQQCTIYAGRPRTCRDYDCRIYAAAGLLPDGQRPVIQARVAEWEFTFTDPAARKRADAMRRAATFIRDNAGLFPDAMRAHSATAAAVIALQVHTLFARPDPDGSFAIEGRVRDIQEAVRRFDTTDIPQ